MGVRHTETSLIVWSGNNTNEEETESNSEYEQPIEAVVPMFDPDRFYDAGDQGCATGPMDEIAKIIREIAAGQTLEIHATDPAVSIDLGAWCRMTGNALVKHRGDNYLIKKS